MAERNHRPSSRALTHVHRSLKRSGSARLPSSTSPVPVGFSSQTDQFRRTVKEMLSCIIMVMDPDMSDGYLSCAVPGAKEKGAYYTPDPIVRSLLGWVVRTSDDRLLDPSCGDGRFIAGHPRSIGIELDPIAAATALHRAPRATIHQSDFFAWAGGTEDRFECAAGNPPFIRYQLFKGARRQRAIALCAELGAAFSRLTSSWPLFLVVAAHLLREGGRMAFVVPAEIGHAPYSAPLIEYLTEHFDRLQIVAIRKKLFPELSEDCWLLYADGKGGATNHIKLSVQECFTFCEMPPTETTSVSVETWRTLWNKRLRPFLLPAAARDLYERLASDANSLRFREFAQVNIGYVSGANGFFHLRPSEVEKLRIPNSCLQTTVRNTRSLPPVQVNPPTVGRWLREDRKTLLLRLRKDQRLPKSVQAYLCSSQAAQAADAFKCRTRDPWYVVPDVKIPDFFLSYMSGRQVSFVRNAADCACPNSLHTVLLKDKAMLPRIQAALRSGLFQFSCEIEGHPLGGGMLKLEPREAGNILVPDKTALTDAATEVVQDGIAALQAWRHYETA